MTSSQIAAIEAREQRIAHLERRLTERENLVALLADRCAKAGIEAARLRGENELLRQIAHWDDADESPFERHPIDTEIRP